MANSLDRASAKFAKGVFRNTNQKWLEANYSHRPVLEAIAKAAFLFFTRKMTLAGGSADIRGDLQRQLQLDRTDDTAISKTFCRDQIQEFTALNVENMEMQLAAKPFSPPTHITYHNLEQSKTDAVKAVNTYISQAGKTKGLIFTDGSFHEDKGGGSAALMINADSSILFATGQSTLHSNHECEIIGILAAFKLIVGPAPDGFNQFSVFTNNKGAILRLKDPLAPKTGQYIYKELMNVWLHLDPKVKLNMVWCLGHWGIQGNEMADNAANTVVTEGQRPPLHILSNFTKARRLILDKTLTPSQKLRRRVPSIGIQASAILRQLATGCCSLNGYLFWIRRVFKPSCPRCQYHNETVTHFFQFCPAYTTQQKALRKTLRRERIFHNPRNVSSALKNLKAWPALEQFVQLLNCFEALKDNAEDPNPTLSGPTCPRED